MVPACFLQAGRQPALHNHLRGHGQAAPAVLGPGARRARRGPGHQPRALQVAGVHPGDGLHQQGVVGQRGRDAPQRLLVWQDRHQRRASPRLPRQPPGQHPHQRVLWRAEDPRFHPRRGAGGHRPVCRQLLWHRQQGPAHEGNLGQHRGGDAHLEVHAHGAAPPVGRGAHRRGLADRRGVLGADPPGRLAGCDGGGHGGAAAPAPLPEPRGPRLRLDQAAQRQDGGGDGAPQGAPRRGPRLHAQVPEPRAGPFRRLHHGARAHGRPRGAQATGHPAHVGRRGRQGRGAVVHPGGLAHGLAPRQDLRAQRHGELA
mmetsp:Transcript_26665/g.78482  ORF Transcript_26665/g.78482 Transcript_26665/m.78482 type:complete len:314 (-) Transcript_26665:1428-2369(-)